MTDLVAELRKRHDSVAFPFVPTTPIVGPTIFSQSADEIERLRNERNAFEAERDELISISNKLKRERDEARRMFCKCHAQAEAIGYAEGRGWDCFKEDGK
jgi:hypothetical protein